MCRIGLLPLYIELYDSILPEKRAGFEAFYKQVVSELERRGVNVVATQVCRLRTEFREAVEQLERADVDLLVTLHLAYSPSLESVSVLAQTPLPLLVLDTTPAHDFGPGQESGEILFNHGIHGVQDLCNQLIRNGKRFELEAGHWKESDVLDRVVSWAAAAHTAASLRKARVGLIGSPFEGMGDFAVPIPKIAETTGIQTICYDPSLSAELLPAGDDPEVTAEMRADVERFDARTADAALHRITTRSGLAVRRWIEREKLTAFSFNFLDITRSLGLPTAPFLEASKAMARGIGYAGEGDILTAGLVGALASSYRVSFTEMFCADWKGNQVFLSHMGEMNLSLSADRPVLMNKPFSFTDVEDGVVAVGRFRSGPAALVNLAPLPCDKYKLITAPGSLPELSAEDKMTGTVRGWFKANLPVAEFLTEYSRRGGTHHVALVYGEDVVSGIEKMGRLLGWDTAVLS
ncbi:MAG: hypothetical protein ACE15E_21385 [Acidobacteriota bacterium]